MNGRYAILAAVAVTALLVAAGLMVLSHDKENTQALTFEEGPSDWNYWMGNLRMPGVSDARTPVDGTDFHELWKVSGNMDGMVWKVPGSAVHVEGLTYYHDNDAGKLRCVNTRTGDLVKEAECPSGPVYNMPIAHGDGKIFVPCYVSGGVSMAAFDARTLERLYVAEKVAGGQVQGPIVYHDGRVFFGTYSGDFVCFLTEDTDTSRGDETVPVSWRIPSQGWYNAMPAFAGRYCVMAEKGYAVGGMVIYVADYRTGAVYDTHKIDDEYCTSGFILYQKDGRIYTASSRAPEGSAEETSDKRLVVRSFEISSDGRIDQGSFRTWESGVPNGGTQSTPVIYNDRLYIGGGGGTLGTDEPFHVLTISADGTMSEAYSVDIRTKATAALTNAYATHGNGYEVYVYLMQYDSPGDIYVLRDRTGQTSGEIVHRFVPSAVQYAFQSFSVSPDGCLVIRNDSTLFCYGRNLQSVGSPGPSAYAHGKYTPADVSAGISRVLAMCEEGYVNPLETERLEARFSALGEDKGSVENYSDMRSVYRTVTLGLSGGDLEMRVPLGAKVTVPRLDDEGIIQGWSVDPAGQSEWVLWNMKVAVDMTLYPMYGDTIAVTFDSDGGSHVEAVRAVKNDKIGYLPVPVKDGYEFAGWYHGGTLMAPPGTFPSSDVELKAKWLRICTVTFDSDGGSAADPVRVTSSKPLGKLPHPSKDGNRFLGWFIGDTEYAEGSVWDLDGDGVLTARWKENSMTTVPASGVEVTSMFPDDVEASLDELKTGSTARRLREAAGPDADLWLLRITGEGISQNQEYVLLLPAGMWGGTEVHYMHGSDVHTATGTEDGGRMKVTIKGNRTSSGAELAFSVPKVSITFVSSGGPSVPQIAAMPGDAIVLPSPAWAGHVFEGWFDNEELDGDAVSYDVMPQTNMVLYAKWRTVNTERSVSCGGMTVTSFLSEDAGMEMRALTGPSMSKMRALAGDVTLKGMILIINGKNMWADQEFELSFSVTGAYPAEGTGTVYYMKYPNAASVQGSISGGVLTARVTGSHNTSSNSTEIVLAVPEDMFVIRVDKVEITGDYLFRLYRYAQLTWKVYPDIAEDQTVTWSSDNESIATVDQNGKVLVKGVGDTLIRLTSNDGGHQNTISVSIKDNKGVVHIRLNDSIVSALPMMEGDVAVFTAEVHADTYDINGITWHTSDGSVATVENGTVTAKSEGKAVITARLSDPLSCEASVEITVRPEGLGGIRLYVNDGSELMIYSTTGYNGYLALKSAFPDVTFVGGYGGIDDTFEPSLYGVVDTLKGKKGEDDRKWHTFVYTDTDQDGTFEWRKGVDALGLYRPFSDYHPEYRTANIALLYGTAAEAEGMLSGLMQITGTNDIIKVTEDVIFEYTITSAFIVEEGTEHPEGYEWDEEWEAYLRTYTVYASDLYRALLTTFVLRSGTDPPGADGFIEDYEFLGVLCDAGVLMVNGHADSSLFDSNFDTCFLPLGMYGLASENEDYNINIDMQFSERTWYVQIIPAS